MMVIMSIVGVTMVTATIMYIREAGGGGGGCTVVHGGHPEMLNTVINTTVPSHVIVTPVTSSTNAVNVVRPTIKPRIAPSDISHNSVCNSHASSSCNHGNKCLLCIYSSPVKLVPMLPWLNKYPDRAAADILATGFKEGFRLGYLGVRAQRDSPNLRSVKLDPGAIRRKLDGEIELGRIVGPFHSRPLDRLMVSPIGLIPKSEPGKFRLIQHLSYPHGNSINDGIDRAYCEVQYASFDVAVGLVASIGADALLAKADIKSAFRLLPIHPLDFELLGIKVGAEYFVDKALPMGASCSPALFERFSSFLEWVTKQVANSQFCTHYADDFLLLGYKGAGLGSCARLVQSLNTTCQKFGVPLATEKSVGPSPSLTYLGLVIDAANQQIAVPPEKITKISTQIEKVRGLAKVSLRELQSLIGSLSFICKAVGPGRAFLRRLINLTCGITVPWHKIRITQGAKADLGMWLVFLRDYNGVSLIPDQMWVDERDLEFFTDASGSIGFGGFFAGRWFQGHWPANFGNSHSITFLEFFPVVVAVVLWAPLLSGKRIILRSDNEAVVAILNKQTSKCIHVMKLVRFMVLQCLKYNLLFSAKHIPGKLNNIADALSRFQESRFREAAPHAEVFATPVPDFLWTL